VTRCWALPCAAIREKIHAATLVGQRLCGARIFGQLSPDQGAQMAVVPTLLADQPRDAALSRCNRYSPDGNLSSDARQQQVGCQSPMARAAPPSIMATAPG